MHSIKRDTPVPRLSEIILSIVLPKDLREYIMGDLYEEFFYEILPACGTGKARRWYRGQVIKSIRFYLLKKKGDIMFFLFSIFIFIAFSVIATVVGKSGAYILVNIPSFIIVIIPSFLFAVAATSVRAWKLGLKLLIIDQDYTDQREIAEATRFMNVFGNMSLYLGFFFTILGSIQTLTGADFSGGASGNICKAYSVFILTLFYGIAFKSIFYVAEQKLRNKFLS